MRRKVLVVEYDVTGLTPGQVDCLTGQVSAQAEAADPYDDESEGHPDVSLIRVAVIEREELSPMTCPRHPEAKP